MMWQWGGRGCRDAILLKESLLQVRLFLRWDMCLGGCAGDMGSAPGAVERLISLNVNGRVRRVDVLPQETLAMTLRYKLGLTGTKLGVRPG